MVDQMIHASIPWGDGSKNADPSPSTDLAAAIVLQAVNDYIGAIRKMWEPETSKKEKCEIILQKMELEEFFYSDWYGFLCDLDPDKVIYNCRIQAEEREKESIRNQNKRKKKQLLKSTAGKEGISQ